METILHIVMPIALGALIGYCTNYIAIKMLFRPQKPVMLGRWQLPFTPGIIPKNKGRLAAAVAHAIESELLTSEDLLKGIQNSPLKEKLMDSAETFLFSEEDCIDGYLEELCGEEQAEASKEQLCLLISRKLTAALKKLPVSEIMKKLMQSSFSSLLSNPLIGMFLNEQTIASIGGKLEGAWSEYMENHGMEMIHPLVKEELYEAAARPMSDNAAALELEPQQVRILVGKAFDLVVEKQGKALLDNLDISTVIEEKINAMEVAQLEELVMSVMKHELQAVINLGLLIGAVIGAVNLLW